MTQHAKKFAYKAQPEVPLRIRGKSCHGFAPDDVLVACEAGCVVDVRDVETDAGHLLDAHGATAVTLQNVYSPISPLHYGVSNFSAVLGALSLRWDKKLSFQQGPYEAWLRLHHIGSCLVEGLRLHGYRMHGHNGPKEAIQIRSGEVFEFESCMLTTPISIGPNRVNGVIDPQAELVREVHFRDCILSEWPRLVAPEKWVEHVTLEHCLINGVLCKFKSILRGRSAA